MAEEAVLEPAPTARGLEAVDAGLDLSYEVESGQAAILAVRHPSNALTFHQPVQSVSRGVRSPSQVRFQVPLRRATTRGLAGAAIKATVIAVEKMAGGSGLLPRLAAAVESSVWKKRGLHEGWLRVSRDTLRSGTLEAATPVSPARSLLFIHGTFSNAAGAYRALAASDFFDRVTDAYADRMFAFDHFTVSRTPEQNVRMLLESLPEQATTFDVVTHSRGGLVLRNLVERRAQFGALADRFALGRAVLVASPNDGTPLATPARWDQTIGWIANLLELFPDNPFTTGAAFVANGLVWLANRASGGLPGLHAMDSEGDLIAEIQGPPGPPVDAYSALVANYNPTGAILQRLLDVGIDQFFATANDLVVPSEGGWRVDRASTPFIPGARIGCFGPGGNLQGDSITHSDFFGQPAAVDFLVNGLLGRRQPLKSVDPRRNLPDRRLLRAAVDAAVPVPAAATAGRVTAPEPAAKVQVVAPLRISIVNGDLTFEPEALLLGHYHAMRLTGTEQIMDRLVGGAMKRSLEMGVYPVAVGSHQIFINTRPNLERGSFMPRPKAVIVAGLGEEGKLRAGGLVESVRQAVVAWAQRLAEGHGRTTTIELAATLLGSGGTGINAGDSARLVAQGVCEANALLARDEGDRHTWPTVAHLRFIELYLDRATDAWRALRLQEAATPGRYAIDDSVQPGRGPLQRPPDSGYRGAEFDFITVETTSDKDGTPSISYTLDTKRARSEVRGQRSQSQLLKELIATASNDRNHDEQIGRTLFNLLIPVELEAYLAGSAEMQMELDPQTAKIPWELLDTGRGSDSDTPWAIRVKLLRKLRIREFRDQVADADADASALVIGEPECPSEYPRLYGARNEALAVSACLSGAGALEKSRVVSLVSSDPLQVGANARTVVNALFERPWRIVHISGHGMPGGNGNTGGVVLSNGAFLGPDEIRTMRTVPELVFVNCCHLGSADAAQLFKTGYDRAEFAAGVAGALIEIGVRCVVAAGWAVDDDAASRFAGEFYQSLLRGNRFIVAVGDARNAAYRQSPGVNTWAAYQCYGDADWVLRRSAPDANEFAPPLAEDYSGVASASSLRLALERIVVRTRFQGADVQEQLANLAQLEKRFGKKWGRSGSVAELFGEAYVEAGDVEAGLRWYERAVSAQDGRAAMRAAEQLSNVRSRLGWELVDKAARHLAAMTVLEQAAGRKPKARAAARHARADAEAALRQAVKRADTLIDASLKLLTKLAAIRRTMERASLLGSAYKRRVLVDGAAGRRSRLPQDLRRMHACYREAQVIGRKNGVQDLYYPASNCLAAEVAMHAGGPGWRRLDRKLVDGLKEALRDKGATDPDFWCVLGEIELEQYEALAKGTIVSALKKLRRAYEDLHQRVTATRMWGSVYDTACLVLPNYASRVGGKKRTAAYELLEQLRQFAHPVQ